MRAIGFYVSPGFQMLDLAGPAGAFEAANSQLESPAYRLLILAADEGAVMNSLGMVTDAVSLDTTVLDTLVVIGGPIDPLVSAVHLAVLLKPLAGAGGLRASAQAHLPWRRLDCWMDVERPRTGDMQRDFSENTRPSELRRIASSVGTLTFGRRRASRPA